MPLAALNPSNLPLLLRWPASTANAVRTQGNQTVWSSLTIRATARGTRRLACDVSKLRAAAVADVDVAVAEDVVEVADGAALRMGDLGR